MFHWSFIYLFFWSPVILQLLRCWLKFFFFLALQKKGSRLFTSTHVVSPSNQSLSAYFLSYPITTRVNCERDAFNLDTEVRRKRRAARRQNTFSQPALFFDKYYL